MKDKFLIQIYLAIKTIRNRGDGTIYYKTGQKNPTIYQITRGKRMKIKKQAKAKKELAPLPNLPELTDKEMSAIQGGYTLPFSFLLNFRL